MQFKSNLYRINININAKENYVNKLKIQNMRYNIIIVNI